VDQIFQAAIEREPAERAAFLIKACGSDTQLRSKVEALISADEEAGSFIERPAVEMTVEMMASEQSQIVAGRDVGPYRLLSRLGSGGMGDVYLAHDSRLGRKVALKLLPAYFTTDEHRLRRFQQEARAASALNHPNIITIFEIGKAESIHFIATEYIKGQTLRERMLSGMIKLGEALDVAIQVASALASAHQAGIVHRDIKPENIMVREDAYVKVLDFGLAKLTEGEVKDIGTEGPTVMKVDTDAGVVMGTSSYMSPEQARGLAVDARSDIWSIGVVLYEMVAGRTPFAGATNSDILVSILEREPPPLMGYEPEGRPEMQRIIRKALSKDLEERYQSVKDLGLDLKRLKHQFEFEAELELMAPPELKGGETEAGGGHLAISTIQRIPVRTEVARATGALPSAEYLVNKVKSHKMGSLLVVAFLTAAVTAFGYLNSSWGDQRVIDSVAVLPLVNVGGDPETEYLSDGITDSLINRLAQLPGVKVIARSSAFRYKGRDVDARTVGRELTVSAVLTGRVMRRGDELSISVELVDTRDSSHLWGDEYKRRFSGIFIIQKDISEEVSERLRLRLTSEEKQQLAKSYTDNTEAYQLYLRGLYHQRKWTQDGLIKGIEYFEQAIAQDQKYALAYAGIADSYSTLGAFGFLPPQQAASSARSVALKALALDDTLAEAHAALGFVNMNYDWDWAAADKEYQRAIDLNPGYTKAHALYGWSLAARGRFEEAFTEMRQALKYDPVSPRENSNLSWFFYITRRYDEAIAQFWKALEIDPSHSPRGVLGILYVQKKMYGEGIAELEKAAAFDRTDAWTVAALGYAYAVAGKKVEAQNVLNELQQLMKQRYVSPFLLAIVYAGLGEKDQAFAWLEKAYEQRDGLMAGHVRVEPRLDTLRSHSRFEEILVRLNLNN
jgi:serine/threonine-protein kinase